MSTALEGNARRDGTPAQVGMDRLLAIRLQVSLRNHLSLCRARMTGHETAHLTVERALARCFAAHPLDRPSPMETDVSGALQGPAETPAPGKAKRRRDRGRRVCTLPGGPFAVRVAARPGGGLAAGLEPLVPPRHALFSNAHGFDLADPDARPFKTLPQRAASRRPRVFPTARVTSSPRGPRVRSTRGSSARHCPTLRARGARREAIRALG